MTPPQMPLPQDAALPHLALALDADRLAPVWAGLLHASDTRVLRCRVDRAKYRAGRNLSVSYRLELQDAQGCFTQPVAARWCSGGESARRHARAATRPLQPSRAGPSFSHVPGLDLSAHWWPNDARLDAGAVLADGGALQQQWLPPVARAAGLGPCVAHEVELAQLVPEHRLTARVQLHTAGSAGGPALAHTVYAKADLAGHGAVTQAVMASLWHSPARRAGRLALARPLLWQPGSGLHWQAAVPGRALLDACPLPDAPRTRQVGRLIAALHATPAPAAPALTLDELRQALRATHKLLCTLQPTLVTRAARVAAALEEGLALVHTGAQTLCTLHGDLHPRNLMLDGPTLTLIDLDGARQGPSVLELGSWLADAWCRAELMGHQAEHILAARHGLLEGYAQGGGQRPGRRALAWATAWQLWCQRIWRCMVNLKPGRWALLPRLLALTEALLAGHEQPAPLMQEMPA